MKDFFFPLARAVGTPYRLERSLGGRSGCGIFVGHTCAVQPEQVSTLLLEETPLGMSVLVQIMNGFGARKLHRCDTVEKAEKVVRETELDLLVVDSMGLGRAGYDFVQWLRQSGVRPNCYAPVALTAAHTPAAAIARARDCGADYTFDCTGNTDVMRQALEACHRGWGETSSSGSRRRARDLDPPLPAGHGAGLEGNGLRRRPGPDRRAADRRLVLGGEDPDRPHDHPRHAARAHQRGL